MIKEGIPPRLKSKHTAMIYKSIRIKVETLQKIEKLKRNAKEEQMNKTIWKFKLEPSELNYNNQITITMPHETNILTIAGQGDDICLWAEVDNRMSAPTTGRTFEVFGTGHTIPCDTGIERKYLGTAIIYNGKLVFHVYERLN